MVRPSSPTPWEKLSFLVQDLVQAWFNWWLSLPGIRNVLHHKCAIEETQRWTWIGTTAPTIGANYVADGKQCWYQNHCSENFLEQSVWNAWAICAKMLNWIKVWNIIKEQWTKFWQTSRTVTAFSNEHRKVVRCHGRLMQQFVDVSFHDWDRLGLALDRKLALVLKQANTTQSRSAEAAWSYEHYSKTEQDVLRAQFW